MRTFFGLGCRKSIMTVRRRHDGWKERSPIDHQPIKFNVPLARPWLTRTKIPLPRERDRRVRYVHLAVRLPCRSSPAGLKALRLTNRLYHLSRGAEPTCSKGAGEKGRKTDLVSLDTWKMGLIWRLVSMACGRKVLLWMVLYLATRR